MRERRPDSLAAEAAFRKRLEELGAELLEPEWLGALGKHHIRCNGGHELYVRPGDVVHGKGVCRRCASRRVNLARTQRAEAEFCARLAGIGAVPLYETWRGTGERHHVRCAAGHDSNVLPSGIQQGDGICRVCAKNDPATAEAAFRARLEELGAMPLFDRWLGSGARHHVACSAGHDCYPTPSNVGSGWGVCKTCAGKSPAVAEANFRARLAEMGCTPLYEEYLGTHRPHHARCAAGHDCYPSPSSVGRGAGICRICARRDKATAEAAFRARVAELGGEVLGEYRNAGNKVHVRCAAGHDAYPRPGDVQQGIGICLSCSGLDPAVAEAKFLARLHELGAVPLYEKWCGAGRKHHVRCAAGHDCYPRPGNVRSGQGICITCAGQDPTVAESDFRGALARLGAVPLFEKWLGNGRRHHIRCAEGHDAYPRPNGVQQGEGLCRTCAGNDPAAAEAAFRERLAAIGAVPLYEKWLGAGEPHRVRCAAGHVCYPRPGSVSQGQGVCRVCKGKTWDVFYVVRSDFEVKFGITSGDPKMRLRKHKGDGFTEVERLTTGLSGDAALDAERAVKAALVLAGERPLRGREYFDISCLALILDVADGWLPTGPPAADAPVIAAEWVQGELFAA